MPPLLPLEKSLLSYDISEVINTVYCSYLRTKHIVSYSSKVVLDQNTMGYQIPVYIANAVWFMVYYSWYCVLKLYQPTLFEICMCMYVATLNMYICNYIHIIISRMNNQ